MKETILLIEDEIELQQNLKEILEFNGFSIVTADNGREGLQKLESHTIDLVLCDIMMPIMDGYQFLKAFQGMDRFHHVPFIFLSARAGAEDRSRGIAAGADDYLTKPISARMLLNTVSAFLDKKKELFGVKESISQTSVEWIGNQGGGSPLKILKELLMLQKVAFDKKDWTEVIRQNEMALAETKCLESSIRKIDLFMGLSYPQNIPVFLSFSDLLEESIRKLGAEKFVFEKKYSMQVSFDSQRIQFVLEELLENAIKFGEEAEPILVTWDGSFMEIKNRQKNLNYGEAVTFQPFCNLHKDPPTHAGLGLGLFLVNEYCLKNNSELVCEVNREGDFVARIQFNLKY